LLRIESVGKTYRMGEVSIEVLRDITLDVRVNELLAIVGPSGSGKTTLLNLIGGLDRPTKGRVMLGDVELSALDARALTAYRRASVGFVFQFFNLIPSLTARENVRLAAELVENPMAPDEALGLLGLGDRAGHFPAQLSGGEQQRVAIARAIVKNPRLLLCDEPTGALDYETGKAVLRAVWDVGRSLGKTVIVITHNQAIGRMADRVVRLRSGQIVEQISVEHPIAPEEVSW
jgi:putative ABC transport system ATP-binding protein